MDIKTEVTKLREKLEKLTWALTSGTALSETKRDQKEEEIKELKKQLAVSEKNLHNYS